MLFVQTAAPATGEWNWSLSQDQRASIVASRATICLSSWTARTRSPSVSPFSLQREGARVPAEAAQPRWLT
jgi:hypothetical protein